MATYRLRVPLSDDAMARLQVGDTVFVSGPIFTARDSTHKMLLKGDGIPGFDMNGGVLYHCGPLAKQEGGKWKILSAGPTTSQRMEPLESKVIERFGVKLIIGKGGMGPQTLEALKTHKAVYASFPSSAALAAKMLDEVKAVHFLEELGMAEAVWVLEAKEFGPLVVSMDSKGRSLYKTVDKISKANLKKILKEKGLDA